MIKKLFVYVTILLLTIRIFGPALSYADDPTPTPTDTPTVTVTPTDTPTDTPTPTVDPSVTDTPTPTPTPTTDPTLTATDSADTTNIATSSADSGDNSIVATDSATPTPTPQPEADSNTSPNTPSTPNNSITTGNATSTTDAENLINSTILNSTISAQTVNLFVDQNGDLNATDPFTIASNEVSQHPNDAVINVEVQNVNNYAYITNAINSLADSGNNAVQSGGSASITTGNAYSLVSLLNSVNFTIVNSTIHVVTINVFGDLNGNIVLPDENVSTNCSDCGVDVNVNNDATVNNTLSSTAVSGQNSISGPDQTNSSITTGNATSAINNENVINTTASNVTIESLILQILGSWDGNFLGWGNLAPADGGSSLNLTSLTTTGTSANGDTLNVNNSAVVNNSITSTANSGNNSITNGNGTITTGNAFSAISLLNFVNTTFVNVNGFFGFINIFGHWHGDIGQASAFITPTPQPEAQVADSNTTQESGGSLSLSQTNNVGTYVYPGDTVTFFINGENNGSGKVYGTSVSLHLFHDGVDMGGTSFNIGDLGVSRIFKISTQFVLSKNAPAGQYTAVAIASGTTGPDNTAVSSESDSSFTIEGASLASGATNPTTILPVIPLHQVVLAAHTNKPTPQSDAVLLLLLGLVLGLYLTIKGIRNRQTLREIWNNSGSFKEKLMTVRILLL